MPYHVKFDGSEQIIEQDNVLQFFLSQRKPEDVVIVVAFDYIQRQTLIFGTTVGGQVFPSIPSVVPAFNTFSINHLTVMDKPM